MLAQSAANFPNCRGHERQRWRGFAALTRNLGWTAIPFIKKYIVPAAKEIGADLFEIAAPEVVSGPKKFQNICKWCWNKNSSITVGKWKEETQA